MAEQEIVPVLYRVTPSSPVPPQDRELVTSEPGMAASFFFTHDVPGRPCGLEMRVEGEGGPEWVPVAAGAMASDAYRAFGLENNFGERTHDLALRQGMWLWQRWTAAAQAGEGPIGAMQQAFRDWSLRVGGVPPAEALSALAHLDQNRSAAAPARGVAEQVAGDTEGVRRAADRVQQALRAVRQAAGGGEAAVPAGQLREHWLALAACGPEHPEAVESAQRCLEQVARTDPDLLGQFRALREADVSEGNALLMTSVVLTLQESGHFKEAAQFREEITRDPAAAERAVMGNADTVRGSQQRLATLAGRRAHAGSFRMSVDREGRAHRAYVATTLVQTVSAPARGGLRSSTAAIGALARRLTASRSARHARPHPETVAPATATVQDGMDQRQREAVASQHISPSPMQR
ncbi:hypothetical protein [Streptomyces sp. NBC_00470]|uniref:hypothetical protein n=1 Tax=Streptomyces sp. NBC_00470 TaxID=2975753 RepID=UPI0030E0ECFA